MHRIGSDVVNTHLVEDASGVMIVDAALPGHWRELNQELRQLSYSLDHVRGIVLTHVTPMTSVSRSGLDSGMASWCMSMNSMRPGLAVRLGSPTPAGDPSWCVRCWDSCGTARDTAAPNTAGPRGRDVHGLRRARPARVSGGLSTFRVTSDEASPCTCQRWMRCVLATS